MSETIQVPVALLERLAQAGEAFRALEDELEDFLMSQNEVLMARLQGSREEHSAGKLRSFSDIRGRA